MTSLFLPVFLLLMLVLAIIVVIKLVVRRSGPAEFVYSSCETLCTSAERAFLGVLDLAVPEGYRVFSKVRLADLIKVRPGLKASARQAAFNRISRKHVDFVLCRADNLTIAAAVELNDSSHGRSDRQSRDPFVDKALASAGILLMRFTAQRAYGIGEVKQAICDSLGIGAAPETEQISTPSPEPAIFNEPSDEFGNCLKCGARMVKRIVKKGPKAGNTILACSAFPKCRTVLPYREPEDPELVEIETPHFRISQTNEENDPVFLGDHKPLPNF